MKSDPKGPLALLVLVSENLLAFRLDQADISPAGLSSLQGLIPKLARITCSSPFVEEINAIIVEGHADASGAARHNWDLSQRRPMPVVRASLDVLDEHGAKEERAFFLQLLSACGRGSAELIMGPSGEENPMEQARGLQAPISFHRAETSG